MGTSDAAYLRRRAFTMGSLALVLGCQKRSEAASAPLPVSPVDAGTRGATRLLEWSFEGAVSSRAAIVVPAWGNQDVRFPVLVALHGRGEARKVPSEGALGWPRDYALMHAISRVAASPLTATDFEGFVETARLGTLNERLSEHPFGGLIVACPYLPDLDLADETAVTAFGAFVTGTLLPRVRRETPALPGPASTGIDGVSLGGAVALRVGLASPNEFGAVGALQPALDPNDREVWAERAKAARAIRPSLKLHLLTSDGDYFREAVRGASLALHTAGVAHDFDLVTGPHDYPFNRGPGAIEMLLWHDRALRA